MEGLQLSNSCVRLPIILLLSYSNDINTSLNIDLSKLLVKEKMWGSAFCKLAHQENFGPVSSAEKKIYTNHWYHKNSDSLDN